MGDVEIGIRRVVRGEASENPADEEDQASPGHEESHFPESVAVVLPDVECKGNPDEGGEDDREYMAWLIYVERVLRG